MVTPFLIYAFFIDTHFLRHTIKTYNKGLVYSELHMYLDRGRLEIIQNMYREYT